MSVERLYNRFWRFRGMLLSFRFQNRKIVHVCIPLHSNPFPVKPALHSQILALLGVVTHSASSAHTTPAQVPSAETKQSIKQSVRQSDNLLISQLNSSIFLINQSISGSVNLSFTQSISQSEMSVNQSESISRSIIN